MVAKDRSACRISNSLYSLPAVTFLMLRNKLLHAFASQLTPRLCRYLTTTSMLITLVALQSGTPCHADTTPAAGMLRYPDVSASHIVFSYAGNLWTVPRTGGVATPLASAN